MQPIWYREYSMYFYSIQLIVNYLNVYSDFFDFAKI